MKKHPSPKPAVVKPKAPPSGYVKIHVDAAISKVHGKGAAAVVCRDGTGNFLGSSALVINGITDVATLEALACREGLSLAADLLVHSFVIASDSKQLPGQCEWVVWIDPPPSEHVGQAFEELHGCLERSWIKASRLERKVMDPSNKNNKMHVKLKKRNELMETMCFLIVLVVSIVASLASIWSKQEN
ncbi:Acid phosphatase 1 [Hordeum vulgare]|nr:Acid phosphatase 1 [Hordeum vulgare]